MTKPLLFPPNRHLEALRIYVHQLRELHLAEAYCDRVYKARQAAKRQEAAARLRRQPSSSGRGGSGSSTAPRSIRSGGSSGGEQGRPAAAGASPGPAAAAAGRGSPGGWQPLVALQPSIAAGEAGAGAEGGPGAAGEDGDFDIYLLLIQVGTAACILLGVTTVSVVFMQSQQGGRGL